MASLVSLGKRVTDVRTFLKEVSGGVSIKYVAEKGAKHVIYIPYIETVEVDDKGNEVVVKGLNALAGKVHEWQTPDGKYKATMCLKDIVRKDENTGVLINDGSCPFCDRIADAWDIYRYRKELEESSCKLVGEEREKHLEKVSATLADERKAKEARDYIYMLVVKFKMNDNNTPVIGADGLPEYELKVMKLSSSRIEKLEQQAKNAGCDSLADTEMIIEYANTDDKRLQVSQSTVAFPFPAARLTAKYPALMEKIKADVAKFEWEGLEKAYPEWAGMSTAEAKATMDALFEKWDTYKQDKLVNPNAKYLEYVGVASTSKPDIEPKAIASGEGVKAPELPDVNNLFSGKTLDI